MTVQNEEAVLAFGVADITRPSFTIVLLQSGTVVRVTFTEKGEDRLVLGTSPRAGIEQFVLDHLKEIADGLACPTLLDCGGMLGRAKSQELYVKLLTKFPYGQQTALYLHDYEGKNYEEEAPGQLHTPLTNKKKMTGKEAQWMVPFVTEEKMQRVQRNLLAIAFQQAGKKLMFGTPLDFRKVVMFLNDCCPKSELVRRVALPVPYTPDGQRLESLAKAREKIEKLMQKLGGYVWLQQTSVYPFTIDFVIAKGNQVFAIKLLPDQDWDGEAFLELCRSQRFVPCVLFDGEEGICKGKEWVEKQSRKELDLEDCQTKSKVERSPYELRCLMNYMAVRMIKRKCQLVFGGLQNDPGYDPSAYVQFEDGSLMALVVRVNEPLDEGKRKSWLKNPGQIQIPVQVFWFDVKTQNPKTSRLYRGDKIKVSLHSQK